VRFLIDTNVISESTALRPDPGATAWMTQTPLGDTALSWVVIGELRKGSARLRLKGAAQRAERLDAWIDGVEGSFDGRLLGLDAAVAREWGRLMAASPTPPVLDAWIAATAIVHKLTVVTRNTRDFTRIGVPVVNPFAA
jgi:predicted nucleic acid-binding protein